MIPAETFFAAAGERGFGLYSGVPCSYLKPFINYAIDAPGLHYVAAANEGEAVAVASGAALAGVPSVAMFQNSGLGNAVNPLTSLNYIFRIPVLLITTLRGEPGGPADEPQHELMGAITTRLLELMEIPWRWFPEDAGGVGAVLDEACTHMHSTGRPFALVMRKGSVAPRALATPPPGLQQPAVSAHKAAAAVASRAAMLAAVQAATGPDELLIATTGYTGRELYALADRDNQLYMVGSMGCASSLGLGLALACPRRRVIVIDGDGAALMRLGAFTTVGQQQPPNLVHLLLDNGIHESTGGQATAASLLDFCALAAASGYPATERIVQPQQLTMELRQMRPGLRFIHLPIKPGIAEQLPRPGMTPAAVARRFRQVIA